MEPTRCRELECGSRPHGYIAAEEDERVDLEEELQVAHREQIDALREQAIHKLVAGHLLATMSGSRLSRRALSNLFICGK